VKFPALHRYSHQPFVFLLGHSFKEEYLQVAVAPGLWATFTNAHLGIAFVTVDPRIRDLVAVYASNAEHRVVVYETVDMARNWADSLP
jgi:hypothetical protein